jgi:hypothetical protein
MIFFGKPLFTFPDHALKALRGELTFRGYSMDGFEALSGAVGTT